MQIDFENWIDRFDNVLTLQKVLGLDIMQTKFNRRELIELRMMIATLRDLTQDMPIILEGVKE